MASRLSTDDKTGEEKVTDDNVAVEGGSPGDADADDANKLVGEKTFSTEEKAEHLKLMKTKQTTALSAITRKMNELSELMCYSDNLHLVKLGHVQFDEMCAKYHLCFVNYYDMLESKQDREYQNKRHTDKETSLTQFRDRLIKWINHHENKMMDHLESASKHSHKSHSSQGSTSSYVSSTRAAYTKEKAKLAELMTEKAMFEQMSKLQKMKLDIQIAKAKAREKVYAEVEGGHSSQLAYKCKQVESVIQNTPVYFSSSMHMAEPEVEQVNLNPHAHDFVPADDVVYPVTGNESVVESTLALQQKQNDLILQTHKQMATALFLPQPEVPKFRGDCTEFGSFLMSFDSRIVPHTSSDTDRLYYLNQHLEGEPKDLIAGCMFMDSNSGYKTARDLLIAEYGEPYKVSTAYVNQVLAWPSIRQDDSQGLKKFSFLLIKCLNAMKSISHMDVLNHAPNLQAVLLKLPFYLQNKWRDHVTKLRFQGRHVAFKELAEFTEFAAKAANEPIFGRQAMNKVEFSSSQVKGHRKGLPFATKSKACTFATTPNDPRFSNQSTCRKQACYFCNRFHDIDDCNAFCEKSLPERRKFLKDHNMCYGCYGYNHLSKGCMRKRTCRKCGKRHPTALHDDFFQLNVDIQSQHAVNKVSQMNTDVMSRSASSCNSTQSDVIETVLQTILPVTVQQKGRNKVIQTYALLDNGSTGCFITDDLKRELCVTFQETKLRLQTMHGVDIVRTCAVTDLIVSDMNNEKPVQLPKTYTRESIPVSHDHIPKPEQLQHWPHLQDVADRLFQYFPELDIGLLIGSNCPAALQPLYVVPSVGNGPFAVKYLHGWTISGPLHITFDKVNNSLTCNTVLLKEITPVKECVTSESLLKMFELDFSEHDVGSIPGQRGHSAEDTRFLETAKEAIVFSEGHYELPLPLRDSTSVVSNNRCQAVKRAMWQKKKMLKDQQYHCDYVEFVEKLLAKGYAYSIPADEVGAKSSHIWYLPHHGIYHPRKSSKIRVVFDCSARYAGFSLNDRLIQGPDLTNSLIGVLTRFRAECVAFIGDIEAMFYQVRVPQEQHDFLRFLWWPKGDLQADLQEYRMAVHIFGAVSSPSISNYALKATAEKAEESYGRNVADTIRKNFYVDDCLKSVKDVTTAIALINDLFAACRDGGFNLTKFICNDKTVLKSLPVDQRSKEVQTIDLDYEDLPMQPALGMQWHIQTDVIGFSTDLPERAETRRGLLSTVSSLYDPLGGAAPVILPAKKILQDLCKEPGLGWDDEIPAEHKMRWHKWLQELPLLKGVTFNRCIKPSYFGTVVSKQLHIFSDASSTGYGCCAYIRLVDDQHQIHTSFLLGKSRLAPLKVMTIPKLELTAASVSVRIGQMLLHELEQDIDDVVYHTDSTTVLYYIKNDRKRFPVFVTNRVKTIRDFTEPRQWRYVESGMNPADVASRGVNAAQFVKSHQDTWFHGPPFLQKPESEWPVQPVLGQDESDIDETVAATSAEDQKSNGCMDILIEHYSSWYKLKRAVAIYKRVFGILRDRVRHQKAVTTHCFTVQELNEAEDIILRHTQQKAFGTELKQLNQLDTRGRGQGVSKTSSVHRLDPFMKDGLLRVGGRLSRACIPDDMKHQILLPKKSHVTTLIIRDVHSKLGHAGRNHVLSSLRERYWVIKANSAVRAVLTKCVLCRRLRTLPTDQKMADLPYNRVQPAPPFTYSGVDFFGPHVVRDGRKESKRYGVLFTCLVSRAVHIESANSLDTDSFLHALRRFISRRGPITQICCDNGTNFVGAARDLKQSLSEVDQKKVGSVLLDKQIDWKFNPPAASHMGGVWERMIRSVRKVLNPLLFEFGDRLDDESYRTLLCEVEAIVNSRPLGTVSDDPNDMNALTPNHLLMMKSEVFIPPLGQFQRSDVYMRRRWRRVQYLANVFWTRWRKEYLLTLQERQKWLKPKRNIQEGDIVLIKDDQSPRSVWSLGRILKTEPDKQGLVRSVNLKTQNGVLRRPVHKLIVLVPNDVV